jgi:hypothetical protein
MPMLERRMKTIIKVGLIFSLFIFMQMHVSEQLQARGRQLAFLRNMPHRYLGLLWYSWILQQHRTDYLVQYAAQWKIATKERGSIIEGTTKPVVPTLLFQALKLHPEDEQLALMTKYLVQDELRDRALMTATESH